jgi:hypothetical protein
VTSDTALRSKSPARREFAAAAVSNSLRPQAPIGGFVRVEYPDTASDEVGRSDGVWRADIWVGIGAEGALKAASLVT